MPFWTILKIIHRAYINKNTLCNNNNSQDTHDEQRAKNNSQGGDQEHIQKISNGARIDNDDMQKDENIVKKRYGRTVRKPDRLTYQ